MFNSKFLLSFIIFTALLIVTSYIKNQTRIIEKKIHKINNKIVNNERNFYEEQLDFFYLTSPSQIEKRVKDYTDKDYRPMDYSNIFLNISHYTDIQNKITTFKDLNEKKIKK